MTHPLSPKERYQRDLQSGSLLEDQAQARVVAQLDDLFHRLRARDALERQFWGSNEAAMGSVSRSGAGPLYLGWSGARKNALYGCFFRKPRFRPEAPCSLSPIYATHSRRADNLQRRETDPLEIVADDIAKEALVLCFDEFFVSDIGDAMILAGLLDALMRRGVTLVATSNIPPQHLYRDGLQRARFLPAIALLDTHLKVVHLESETDYRFRTLERADLWHIPHDNSASESLAAYFISLTGQEVGEGRQLEINNRAMPARAAVQGVAWFEFKTLCEEARSAADFVEIAREVSHGAHRTDS